MKRVLIAAVAAALYLMPPASGAEEEKPPPKKELKTFTERLSYVVGLEIGKSLKNLGVKLDLNVFLLAVKDVIAGNRPLLNREQVARVLDEMQERRATEARETATKNRKAAETFLAENKKKKGVVNIESGLQYTVIKEGEGPRPKDGDTVRVHYKGKLLDGTEFDSSYKRGRPAFLEVAGVIPGFSEGLKLMKVGGQYRLFLPPDLAYGARGAEPDIGPNCALIFDVRLIKIQPKPEPRNPEPPK